MAILIWIGTLSILAAQLLGMSTVFQVVAGTSTFSGCVLGAALVALYFVAGGLLGSAYVNLVQLAVKLAGFAIVTPMAMALAGGWDAIAAIPRGSIPSRAARRSPDGACCSSSAPRSSSRRVCCRRLTARATRGPSRWASRSMASR